MKIYNLNTKTNIDQKNFCLTVGNFDGIHRGHQYVIKEVLKVADENKLKSAILSFNPHPKIFFKKFKMSSNIITKENKLDLLKNMGISIYLDYIFDSQLSSLSAEEFVDLILVKQLAIKLIIVGADFRFGKNRSGNLDLLNELSQKNNFQVKVIEPVKLTNNDAKYTSSLIREQIKKGLFTEVNRALNRYWQMTGNIIKGDQRASKMDFPTANMFPPHQILPKYGVYCVNAIIENKKYCGISNFGQRPTVDGSKLLLETHLFGFNDNIYGKELTVEFLTFIRPEQKFKNFEKLTEQIKKDVITAKSYHNL